VSAALTSKTKRLESRVAPPAGIIIFAPRALRSSVANQAQSAARESERRRSGFVRSNENIAAKWAEKLIGQAQQLRASQAGILFFTARAPSQNNFSA
jgi:hypothetical protein